MTQARQAREAAGISLTEASRRAGVSAKYLQRIERQGWAYYSLACRLAALYNCRLEMFVNPTKGGETVRANRGEAVSAATSHAV